MDHLDKERVVIMEEMNRLRALLEVEKAKKKAGRVDDIPSSSGPSSRPKAGPAGDWGGSTESAPQQFAPQPSGAKPRKKEF